MALQKGKSSSPSPSSKNETPLQCISGGSKKGAALISHKRLFTDHAIFHGIFTKSIGV